MHGRLVDNNQLIVVEETVQLTCSLVTIFYWSWTYKLLWHSKNVSDRCWPECGVLISSTSYSGFYLSLVQLIAWAEDTYIGSTLRFPIVSSTLKSLFSPSDENIQLETLGEEFDLAGMSDGEDTPYFEFWTLRCIGIVRTMTRFTHLICPRVCVMRCFGLVRTIPTSSSSWSTDHTFDLGLCLLLLRRTTTFFDDFDHRVRTTLSLSNFGLHCGSAITVVERLQRYNCIWLTYIDNVEQNILFYIKVWSCEILSLCGKLIWKWNAVFWLCFAFRRRLCRYLVWITSFLRSWRATLVSWLFTFGWEPVCFENFWKCFDLFEFN